MASMNCEIEFLPVEKDQRAAMQLLCDMEPLTPTN